MANGTTDAHEAKGYHVREGDVSYRLYTLMWPGQQRDLNYSFLERHGNLALCGSNGYISLCSDDKFWYVRPAGTWDPAGTRDVLSGHGE